MAIKLSACTNCRSWTGHVNYVFLVQWYSLGQSEHLGCFLAQRERNQPLSWGQGTSKKWKSAFDDDLHYSRNFVLCWFRECESFAWEVNLRNVRTKVRAKARIFSHGRQARAQMTSITKKSGQIVSRPKFWRKIRISTSWKLKVSPRVRYQRKMTKKHDFGP